VLVGAAAGVAAIATVAIAGLDTVALVASERITVNAFPPLPLATGIEMLFAALSPSAQLSVPLVAV
jgi:hypothetical protein